MMPRSKLRAFTDVITEYQQKQLLRTSLDQQNPTLLSHTVQLFDTLRIPTASYAKTFIGCPIHWV